MKRIAYTISELLITLGVVGVIVALTVPTLVNSYQKHVYAKTLAVAIADFNNALKVMEMNEGAINPLRTKAFLSLCDENGSNCKLNKDTDPQKIEAFVDGMAKYFQIERKILNRQERFGFRFLYDRDSDDGVNNLGFGHSKYGFRTDKNIDYLFQIYQLYETDNNTFTQDRTGYYGQECGLVWIDVNGEKEPNRYGRDVFMLGLHTQGIAPRTNINLSLQKLKDQCVNGLPSNVTRPDGTEGVEYYRGMNGCGEYLMKNGYKMDY